MPDGERVLTPPDLAPRVPTAFGPNVQVNAPEATAVTQRRRRAAAAQGKLYVVWDDFRNYNWDMFFTRTGVMARGPRRNVRVDDYPSFERLNTEPALALDPDTDIVSVAWADIRTRETDSNIFFTQATRRSARLRCGAAS